MICATRHTVRGVGVGASVGVRTADLFGLHVSMHYYMRPVYDLLALTCMQQLPLRAHLHAACVHMLLHASVYCIPLPRYTASAVEGRSAKRRFASYLRRSVERLRRVVVMRAGPGPVGLLAGAARAASSRGHGQDGQDFQALLAPLDVLGSRALECPGCGLGPVGTCARHPWEQTLSAQQAFRT